MSDNAIFKIGTFNKVHTVEFKNPNDQTYFGKWMDKMKLEAGKYYKTRDGRKAYLAGLSDDEDMWVGIVYRDGEFHRSLTWFGNEGKCTTCLQTDDLVSEWVDEEPKALAYVQRSNGCLFLLPEDRGNERVEDGDFKRMPHLDEPEGQG